ncbi:MAG: translation elongation factor Ts [Verrucomicrobia bacterium]|nr:translation elongation factor Ts [Verrucomicrobiota bacterium]
MPASKKTAAKKAAAPKKETASSPAPAPAPAPAAPKAAEPGISAAQVKELRDKTGAPMMTCKTILTEVGGDMEKAITELRKRDAKVAEKKAGREAKEGVVASYIHLEGRIGVLMEVNCETDFVAKNNQFRDFVRELTLHIAAASPLYVRREDVPAALIEKESEIFAEQMKGKPAAAMAKILEGKLNKFYSTVCLLEQGFIKDPDQTIEQLLKKKIAELGENLVIRRFTRYALGEEA